ncbi:MAG TPA: PAS domain S-box protein [Verrucomicrobiae bacterium]
MKAANRPLQILLVEDSDNDALLLDLALQRAGFTFKSHRVETPAEMSSALDAQQWDVVIADYVLPQFDGLGALAMVKGRGLDLPFIIVSGHINEDTAVAAMKAGAHDYVMKGNLARLAPAIDRELRESEVRRAQRASEKELWEEQAFRGALETSIPSSIAVVDLNGTQTYVNRAFCRTTGWRESELLGKKPPFDYWPPEEIENITGALARVASGQSPPGGLELRLRHKDGHRFDVLILVTALKDTFDNVTGWLSSFTDITQRKQAEDALRRSHEELEHRVLERTADLSAANDQLQAALAERRRLEHELLEITDKERRRIGLDLHDDLGQKLTGIALMSKGLATRLARHGIAESEDALRIQCLIQETMNQTRELSHDLVTLDVPEKDLVSAMEDLVRHLQKTFEISCNLVCTTPIPQLEANTVTQLYKITQEAVTNAIKHGKSKEVEIRLRNGDGVLTLSIRNAGLPFPAVVDGNAGIGLRIMSYRAHLIGATFEVKPGEQEGAVVTCKLPTLKKTA